MPIPTFSTSSLSEFANKTPREVSTASLAVAADASDTTNPDTPTAEERFEDSVEDDSAAFFTIIESFVQLFPSPSGDQLKNLADSLLLEGQDREDFILLTLDVLTGSDGEVDLSPDDTPVDGLDTSDDPAESDASDEEDDGSDDDDDDGEDDEAAEAETAALLSQVRAMGLDPLTDALMNDGQAVSIQPDVDDLSIQDDGEVDFSIIKPSVELPEGNNDGASMDSPINNPESPV